MGIKYFSADRQKALTHIASVYRLYWDSYYKELEDRAFVTYSDTKDFHDKIDNLFADCLAEANKWGIHKEELWKAILHC